MLARLRDSGPLAGPFLLWAALALVFALGGWIRGASPFSEHFASDQHTRQASAWLQGKLPLENVPPTLEVASFHGKLYSGLPPVPALFELPWVMLFGKNAPNRLALLFWAMLGAWAIFEIGLRAGWTSLPAGLIAFCFMAGTNLFVAASQGGSEAANHVIGFVLAVLAIGFVFRNDDRARFKPWIGYLLLAFAAGCRPIYLLYFPLLVVLDARLGRSGQLRRILGDALYCAIPVLVVLALYNWIRFDNPLEFGKSHEARFGMLPHGLFSAHYFDQNLSHAAFKLPSMSFRPFRIEFDPAGNAFWLNNPVFLFCLAVGLFRPANRVLRIAWLITLVDLGFLMLIHEPGGSLRFGCEFIMDLLPLAFLGLLVGATKKDLLPFDWTLLSAYSLVINLIGSFWLRNHV